LAVARLSNQERNRRIIMKTRFSLLLAALLCAGSLMPVAAQADPLNDRPHPLRHMVWVHRHFIVKHHHRVFWVPGHPELR
jgi:energy-converting hydrogenase Eha subunit F